MLGFATWLDGRRSGEVTDWWTHPPTAVGAFFIALSPLLWWLSRRRGQAMTTGAKLVRLRETPESVTKDEAGEKKR